MKLIKLIGSISLFILPHIIFSQDLILESPDKNIQVSVKTEGQLSWSLNYKDNPVIEGAEISMVVNGEDELGKNPRLRKSSTSSNSNILHPIVPYKDSEIKDEYNELVIELRGNYKVTFRAYNDGIAYRFSTSYKGDVEISSEVLNVPFADGAVAHFPQEESFYSHYERTYQVLDVTDISEDQFCSLPALVNTGQNVKVWISDADLFDYPNMFLAGGNNNSLHSIFPKHVLETKPTPGSEDRNELITKEADYIAKTAGSRNFPWRVFIVSDDDRTFLESNLVFQLSRPAGDNNLDWIKPGKVAWDWYNANNIYGVDFKSGLNTETYKYYIDFASEYGLDYIILDEGWTKSTTEIKESNPDIDIPELISYGQEKNVGIILWVLWGPLYKDLEANLQLYSDWGAKGVKVDFMQRADQGMVNIYERIGAEAMKRKLLVDFHGAFKPGGMMRAYPNIISHEGVKGAEHNKWSADVTPEHNVTLPFLRMLAGPMDYTPGSMRNGNQQNFSISFERPMSQGTRCHQIAMYVVYESPLQMLCDAPSAYYGEKETVEFISQIPTTWDETVVLHGKVSDYMAIARRKGDTWYVGAMTDWTAREMEIDFSFLPEGAYKAQIMRDGINANRFAEDYKKVTTGVTRDSKLKIQLAPGGGWAAIVTKN